MTAPDQTRAFLLLWLLALAVWECFAVIWLDRDLPHGQPQSSVSAVVGELFRIWPPLFVFATVCFCLFLWHVWDVTRNLKP
jgi:hypothetical protein